MLVGPTVFRAKFRRPVCKISQPRQNCPNSAAHHGLAFVSKLSYISC